MTWGKAILIIVAAYLGLVLYGKYKAAHTAAAGTTTTTTSSGTTVPPVSNTVPPSTLSSSPTWSLIPIYQRIGVPWGIATPIVRTMGASLGGS